MPLPSASLRAAATQPPAALVCARLRVAAGCGQSFLICLRAAPAIKAAALRSPLRSLRSRPFVLRTPGPPPFAPLASGSRLVWLVAITLRSTATSQTETESKKLLAD